MNEAAVLFAERAVPRYTSYPTAPHFTAAVDAASYAAWLAALPAGASLSLYLHVPYCAELCHYCGCHTKAVHRREPVEAYADRLIDEIVLLATAVPSRKVTHVHWGGGTPSILGIERLGKIAGLLRARFDLDAIREHAIELDPRHVTPALAETLATIGVNRASLGVQDLSPHVQQVIGRIQPFETVERAVRALRAAGIDRINFDLMYGLPRQTVRDVERSATLAASLGPQRLAVFGYAHVPWFKKHQRLIDESMLPSPAERLEQFEATRTTLTGLGYMPIGLDHFARRDDELAVAAESGRLHRNFQGYTTDDAEALIGLGASAIGRLPQGYAQNAPDIGRYALAVKSGRFATVKGVALSADDRLRGTIIERLMCDLAVDLDEAAGEAGAADRFSAELAELEPLARQGLVQVAHRRVVVTERGRPFVRLAAAAFDAHLREGRARHSLAV